MNDRDELQNEALSRIFTAHHVGKREVYAAFTGIDYAQRPGGYEADPAHVTRDNMHVLYAAAFYVKRGYLGQNLPQYYGPDLDRMIDAHDKNDIEGFTEAANDLLSKIVNE